MKGRQEFAESNPQHVVALLPLHQQVKAGTQAQRVVATCNPVTLELPARADVLCQK
jgi:hypothetical protein